MQSIQLSALNAENLRGLGSAANLLCCEGKSCIGEPPVTFYRDMLWNRFDASVAFSVVQCDARPFIIDEAEQHFHTAEGLLPLDGDVAVFAGAATNRVPPTQWKAFIVPRGTLLLLDAGVWHKAPFPISGQTVHSLIVLPPLTYANDCLVVRLNEKDHCKIEIQ